MRTWNPYKINEKCPVFVVCQPSQSGLGDKLEHYVYSMNVAKMYLATLIIDAEDFVLMDANTHHLGMNEYYRLFLLSIFDTSITAPIVVRSLGLISVYLKT